MERATDLGVREGNTEAEQLPPGFGALGEDPEAHERARVHGLAEAGPQPPVLAKERAELPAASEVRAAKAVVRELLGEMRDQVRAVATEIKSGNDLLRHLDVPLEQVADSHERATHSFETLRADIDRLAAQQALTDARVQEILKLVRQARG